MSRNHRRRLPMFFPQTFTSCKSAIVPSSTYQMLIVEREAVSCDPIDGNAISRTSNARDSVMKENGEKGWFRSRHTIDCDLSQKERRSRHVDVIIDL